MTSLAIFIEALGLLCGIVLKIATSEDVAIRCPDLAPRANGFYRCQSNDHKVNDKCHLECHPGFVPSLHSTITCQSSGTWSPHEMCIPITCPALPNLANGVYKCSRKEHRFHDKCHIECHPGFESTLHSDITCKASGTWSAHGWCVPITCPALPNLANGVYKCSRKEHRFSDKCHIECHPGFESTLHSDITCKASGTWSAHGMCVPVVCSSPPTVHNGTYLCSSHVHTVDSVCRLHCHNDFKPSSSTSEITCKTTGTWTTPARCVQIPCPSPPAVSQGTFSCSSGSHHNPGSTCSLSCSRGYKPSDSSTTITCLSSSKWSTSATCIHEIPCPSPPAVSQGTFSCSSGSAHNPGSTCSLSCSSGYKPSNSSTLITCLSISLWSFSATCTRDTNCPAPPRVINGIYRCSSNVYKVDGVCLLQCSPGYKPHSSQLAITCLPSRRWSIPTYCVASSSTNVTYS